MSENAKSMTNVKGNCLRTQGNRELRDSSGLSAISRRKRALTDPISPGWRLNLARFFHQVAERGRKVKVRDCPACVRRAIANFVIVADCPVIPAGNEH